MLQNEQAWRLRWQCCLPTRCGDSCSARSDSRRDAFALVERDPASGLRDIDFDLMEIANGSSYPGYLTTRRDWFSLMHQGERIVGTANSDSHGSREIVAIPQNYVKLAGDYNEAGFIAAVKAGRLTGTTGPLLDVYASTGTQARVDMGETVESGDFSLHLSVSAASWIPVDKLTVYLNGEVYHREAIERGTTLTVPVNTDRPGFLIAEVTGTAGGTYELIAPGFTPLAFSNPIYINPGQR